MCNIVGVTLMKCSCLMLSKKDKQILTKKKSENDLEYVDCCNFKKRLDASSQQMMKQKIGIKL